MGGPKAGMALISTSSGEISAEEAQYFLKIFFFLQGSVDEDYGEIGLESFVRKNTPHFQKEGSAPIGILPGFLM